MAKIRQINQDLYRKNINIPHEIDKKVREIADTMGLTYTATIVLLLNTALNNSLLTNNKI